MKKQKGYTLIEVLIVLAIIGIIVAIVAQAFGYGREDRCKELCEGLRCRMVKVTSDHCICEDPDTKSRQAYPMVANGTHGYGAPTSPPTRPALLEQE